MGNQTKAQVSKLLTTVSNKYTIDNAIAEQVLPVLKVKQSTGIIGGYGKGHLRQEDDLMGGQAEARRATPTEYDLTQGYKIQNHGLQGVVTPDDVENVEEPFDAEVDTTEDLSSLILVNKELFCKNTIMNPAVVTQGVTLAGNDKFSDAVNSDPLGVAKDAAIETLDGCGRTYNACIMSEKTYQNLKYHPQILERLGFAMARAGLLSKEDIMRAFDLKYLYVGEAAYNTAKEGQTAVLSQMWGAEMLFYYRPEAAAKKQVSFGYYLQRMDSTARKVFKAPLINPPESTSIIVQDLYDYRVVNAKAGYLVQGTY